MNTMSRRSRWLKFLQVAALFSLVVACLLIWTRALSLPVFADPQDVDIREFSEGRAQQVSQQYGKLCIEIVHFTPDGTLLTTGLRPSDGLPQEASALVSKAGISGQRVGDKFTNAERLLVSSTAVPRAVAERGTSIIFEAVELRRFSGGAKGTVRWEVTHSEMAYPCDQEGRPVPLRN